MNKYAKVENFINILGRLNPEVQFKIDDIDSIAVKGRNPRYLKLPRGYEYDVKLKAITNNGSKFNIIHE